MSFAAMTAMDMAAIVATAISLVAVVALTWMLLKLVQAVDEARDAVRELREDSEPVIAELTSLNERAERDFDKIDDLIGSAEALAAAVDSAARVGYLTIGKPVIKTMALAKGTSRAARRIRPPKAG